MTDPRAADLAASLAAVRHRLDDAVAAAGRPAEDVELLPVTKFFPASDVLTLVHLGCRDFGESREQEASRKIAEVGEFVSAPTATGVAADSIRWHMVGHVQRNKARAVATWAYAVHSVDGRPLADALSRGAARALDDGLRTDPLRVYVQLSLDGDSTRSGVELDRPDLVDELCDAVAAADGLELVGLMAVPPLDADADAAFDRLEAELARVRRRFPQRLGLSAGMSGDLETAVRHGSTCVRVGTALMGQRPLASP